jgi:hypothetical protein
VGKTTSGRDPPGSGKSMMQNVIGAGPPAVAHSRAWRQADEAVASVHATAVQGKAWAEFSDGLDSA